MSRSTRLLASALLLAGATLGGYFYPPVRLLAKVAVGRSPHCPLSNALQCANHLRALTIHKDRIVRTRRFREVDPAGYSLWDTPHGRFWIPEGNENVLSFNLAEQENNIYGVGDQAVRAGDVVLDCGANVGVYTRKALEAGASAVVAIEPGMKILSACAVTSPKSSPPVRSSSMKRVFGIGRIF